MIVADIVYDAIIGLDKVVTFPLVSWYQVWCLIVLIPDRCPLSYFDFLKDNSCKLDAENATCTVKGRSCKLC